MARVRRVELGSLTRSERLGVQAPDNAANETAWRLDLAPLTALLEELNPDEAVVPTNGSVVTIARGDGHCG